MVGAGKRGWRDVNVVGEMEGEQGWELGSDARVVGEKTGKDWRVMNMWWEERRKTKVEETDIPVVGEKK